MTNKQAMEFLSRRAEANGKSIRMSGASIVVVNAGRSLALGVKYSTCYAPFIMRFIRNGMRGIFMIPDGCVSLGWHAHIVSMPRMSFIRCDAADVPHEVHTVVKDAVVSALKTNGMGIDCFTPMNFNSEVVLVKPSESYEEAMIENDLAVDSDFMPAVC